VLVEVPVQKTLFRVLPVTLQAGREIGVCAVLFTQGVNELQSLADTCVTCTGMYLPLPRFLPNYQSTRSYTHAFLHNTHMCMLHTGLVITPYRTISTHVVLNSSQAIAVATRNILGQQVS